VVVLPSLESGVVGTIVEIESSPTQPVQKGYVVSEIPIQSLRLVGVGSRVPVELSFEQANSIIEAKKSLIRNIEIPEDIIVDVENATSTEGELEEEEIIEIE